tara:strand:+ start:29460 stop:30299 length:840 start_codon:yes stop_codon:yes gene_type:complete
MEHVFDILPLVLLLMSLGAVAGFMAGLLGVGGGIVLVPGLYYVFSSLQPNYGFDPSYLMHLSVATSLAIIVPTGSSSAFSHYKKGSVDFELLKAIGIGIVIGVLISTWIAKGLDGQTMRMIFATAVLLLAFIMILGRARFQAEGAPPKQPKTTFAGVVIGGISALIGIGGATLSVPYMSMHGVSMHRAVGTASALGLVISIPATIGYIVIGWGLDNLPPYSLGYVNMLAWICIIPVSVLIAPLGAKAAHKISVRRLKITFSVFMIIVALNMWRKILMGA